MTESTSPVRFCCLTPQGRGAIATTMVWGSETHSIVARYFRSKRKGPITTGDIVYGNWTSPTNAGEDVVVTSDALGRISIHSHGGLISQRVIADDLRAAGAVEMSPAEFTYAEAGNFWTGEIQMALQKASTEFAALTLLEQLEVWPAFINALENHLSQNELVVAKSKIDEVLAIAPISTHLVTPWRIVLCGQPNVGKSSLVNALLGFDRVIVSEIPGTTRDVVRHHSAIQGWPVVFADTAGLRREGGEIERMGMQLGREEIATADCVIAVFDSSQTWTDDDARFLEEVRPHLIVFNKCDIAVPDDSRPLGLYTSAIKRQNIDELLLAALSVMVPTPFYPYRPMLVSERMAYRARLLSAALASQDLADSQIHLY
ncbi:MAG: GTPase [Pirellulaceae bacterium]